MTKPGPVKDESDLAAQEFWNAVRRELLGNSASSPMLDSIDRPANERGPRELPAFNFQTMSFEPDNFDYATWTIKDQE